MSSSIFDLAAESPQVVVKRIRKGLPSSDFGKVADVLRLTHESLARKLGIAPRTLLRRKNELKPLSATESEKLIRIARIRNQARDLFKTDDKIAEWLGKPDSALGGEAPIDMIDTDFGAREVESLINGLAHGLFQ